MNWGVRLSRTIPAESGSALLCDLFTGRPARGAVRAQHCRCLFRVRGTPRSPRGVAQVNGPRASSVLSSGLKGPKETALLLGGPSWTRHALCLRQMHTRPE